MTKKTSASWDDFDLTKQSEDAFEFEYLRAGKETGAFVKVIGKDAPKFEQWVNAKLTKMNAEELAHKKRTGRDLIRPIEEQIQFSIEAAAMRIVGWSGFPEDYTHEKALWLMERNSELREQVLEASNNLGNFIKKPSTNLSNLHGESLN